MIIPCFNEGGTIHENIKKIHGYLSSKFEDFEIIAINDGSYDNTLEELEKTSREIPLEMINFEKNSGKGKSVRDGILRSKKEVVMFLDADLAIPIEELEKFMIHIQSGSDMVIASRFVPGLKIIKPVLWYRKIMERVFRFLRMLILNNWKIKDTQCGFKVFKGEMARRIFKMSTIARFAFDSEIIFIAKKLGYSIKELPIALQNPKTSSIRIIFDSLNMFFSLLKIRFNDLSKIYKWKED